MDDELKMWVAVRTDLGMSLGKAMAQAGHAFGNLFVDAWASHPETMRDYTRGRTPGSTVNRGQAKIVVVARNEGRLRRVADEARAAGIPYLAVEDEGRSEVEPGTLTVVAFGPARRGDLPKYLQGLQRLADDRESPASPEGVGTDGPTG